MIAIQLRAIIDESTLRDTCHQIGIGYLQNEFKMSFPQLFYVQHLLNKRIYIRNLYSKILMLN